MLLWEALQQIWAGIQSYWQEILIYTVLGVIALGVLAVILHRRKVARRKYNARAAEWGAMGYEQKALSPHGACIWLNRAESKLLCAKENTEKFRIIPYSSVASFSLYDTDFMLAYGVMGEPMQYGDWREAKGAKSESLKAFLRLTDGSVTELLLCDANIPRASREYEELCRMVNCFVATLLEVKAANEAASKCIPTDAPKEAVTEDPAKLDVESKLRLLKDLYDKGLISEEQYKTRSTEILSEI